MNKVSYEFVVKFHGVKMSTQILKCHIMINRCNYPDHLVVYTDSLANNEVNIVLDMSENTYSYTVIHIKGSNNDVFKPNHRITSGSKDDGKL